MISSLPPTAEFARLAALRSHLILDTPDEAEFDDITHLASLICDTPIALITLVDEHRQWFKSKVGLSVCETPRDISFCAHAIRGADIFEVPNAAEDERFHDNPLVTGEPKINFYAGIPLSTAEGHNLGTLCVIDRKPRQLTPLQRDAMKRLGRLVVQQIEFRLSTPQLQSQLNRSEDSDKRPTAALRELANVRVALDEHSIVAVTDGAGRIISVNDKLCEFSGHSREELIGQDHRIINSGHHSKQFIRGLWTTVAQGKMWRGEICNRAKGGSLYWIATTIVPFINQKGKPDQYVAIGTDISAKKHTAQKLQRTREQMEQTMEAANMAEWEYNFPSDTFTLNERLYAILGTTVEIEGGYRMSSELFIRKFCLPEDAHIIAGAIARAVAVPTPGRVQSLEFQSRRPSTGITRVNRLHYKIEYDEGSPTHVSGLHQDITEHRQDEEQLHLLNTQLESRVAAQTQAVIAGERFNRASLDALSAHIAILDEAGIIITVNRTWRVFALENGLSSDWVWEGKNYLENCDNACGHLWRGDQGVAAGARAVIRGEQDQFVIEQPCHSPTQQRWFLCCVTRFHGDGPVRVALAYEDITPIKLAQLGAQQALAMLDATDDCAFIFDPDTLRLSYVNQGAVRQLGYTETELHEMTPVNFSPDFDAASFRDFLAPMQRGEEGTRRFKAHHRHKDGHDISVENYLQYITPEVGPPCFINIANDIGERERTEELRAANRELTRISLFKSEFLANMSHELRTPLNAILGLSEAMLDQISAPPTPRQAKSLTTIHSSGQHLLSLINDILDLSKVEAGALEMHAEPLNVRELCESCLLFVRTQAMEKNLWIDTEFVAPTLQIHADPKRCKQILVNLLNNAVKFTPAGGRIGLRVAVLPNATGVQFTVWDTGIGISIEDQFKLFRPFSQIDSGLARSQEGTGLGLALVARLVELLGGSLSLESEPGQGSQFSVVLPLTVGAAPGPALHSNLDRRDYRRALLIAEDARAGEQLQDYLTELNLESAVHRHRDKAVEAVLREQPDVIFLDILLPNKNGWDVLAKLKANPTTRFVPVVVISIADEAGKAKVFGADTHFTKPITRQQLAHFLQREKVPLASSEPPFQSPPTTAGGPLILLAEDNAANRETIGGYLQDRGYTVHYAHNGREAVQSAQELKPALILMDIQMPVLDGIGAMREIRADLALRDIPIVALTALAMPGDRERCLAAGATEYLSKPVSLMMLTALVEKSLTYELSHHPSRRR